MNRLDHVLLGVSDLDGAARDFREKLGMNVVVGGVHPNVGTHNALVHFGNAYLELIGVHDASLPRGQALSRFLADGDGPYGFALAVDALSAQETQPPREGARRTPTGQMLRWRAADMMPGGDAPVPFLIQWLVDDADGRAWFDDRVRLADHPLGWGSVHAMIVATDDPAGLAADYAQRFGWERLGAGSAHQVTLRSPSGSRVNPTLGEAPRVVVIRPTADRLVDRALRTRLNERGSGFAGLAINVPNLPGAVEGLRQRGARVESHGPWAMVDPGDVHGMVLELVGP